MAMRWRTGRLARRRRPDGSAGHLYRPDFLDARERRRIVEWLETLHPIWEQRFSQNHPPPPGQTQRALLRLDQ